jgi:hypothetical protein
MSDQIDLTTMPRTSKPKFEVKLTEIDVQTINAHAMELKMAKIKNYHKETIKWFYQIKGAVWA